MSSVNFPTVEHILKPSQNVQKKNVSPQKTSDSFSTYLRESLKKVNDAQIESNILTEKLVKGDNVDLHDVMISAQKANITLQTTIEVRNKIIEAYQEVMRMQV